MGFPYRHSIVASTLPPILLHPLFPIPWFTQDAEQVTFLKPGFPRQTELPMARPWRVITRVSMSRESPGSAPGADGISNSSHTPQGFITSPQEASCQELPREEREIVGTGRAHGKEVGRRKRAFSLVTRVHELRKGAPQWQRHLPLQWRRM